jgi:membrane-bound ClpP family serine protease
MSSDDLHGLTGRVVTPIGPDAPGEVMISIRGGSECFIATSADGTAIRKGARVSVIEHIPPRRVVVSEY